MSGESPILDAETDRSGTRLGPYHLLRLIGRGGMASVYLAEQPALGRFVAVKILKSALATQDNYVRRFEREAKAAAALVHPNIVPIHEIGLLDNLHFIAQEYVPGTNLKQFLQKQTPSLMEIVSILRQVAAALEKAESHGIVHRDIKPENILVSPDLLVKVADFGLARAVDSGTDRNLTQTGMTLGTPLYMSPEQIQGHDLDSRSDVYSLGVTAYRMLAGRPPFEAENAITLAVRQLNSEPEPLDAFRPDLPANLVALVHEMLHKRREQRPFAQQLRPRLEQLEMEFAQGASSGSRPVPTPRGLTASGLEATRRLASLLGVEDPAVAGKGRLTPPRWILGPVAGLLLGWVLAIGLVSRDPLARVRPRPEEAIPRLESLQLQYLFATAMDSIPAWESVLEYARGMPALGPEEEVFLNTARRKLAVTYLEREQSDRARGLFQQLAGLGESENELRALGFAGLFVIAAEGEDWPEAERLYAKFLPLKQDFAMHEGDAALKGRVAFAESRLNPEARQTGPAPP